MVRVTTCTQSPFEIQNMLAPILDLPAERVRVTGAPIGGGFGGKCDSYVEPHAAIAAFTLRRKVQIPLTRRESLILSTKRHRYHNHYRFGVDGNGIFRTLEAKITSDAGPYTGLSGGVLEQGCISRSDRTASTRQSSTPVRCARTLCRAGRSVASASTRAPTALKR